MPVLHFRVNDGSPFIRTAPLNLNRERIYLIWTPDAFAMRRLDEEGIRNEGDWIEWDLFYDLKAKGHILCGAECQGGLEPGILDMVENIRDLSRIHSRNAKDAEGDDFHDLAKDFEKILDLIAAIRGNDELKSQRFLSLAQKIMDLTGSHNQELSQYGRQCRERLIQCLPGTHRDSLQTSLREYFQLDDNSWIDIRSSCSMKV